MHLHFPRIWVSQIFFFFFRSFVLKPVKEAEQRSLIFQEQNMLFKKAKNRAKIVNVLVFEHLFFWVFLLRKKNSTRKKRKKKEQNLYNVMKANYFMNITNEKIVAFFKANSFLNSFKLLVLLLLLIWHGMVLD